MAIENLLYASEIEVTDKISIIIPTVGEILENESSYYALLTALTAMPIDFMVQLDELGIDFAEINDYDLFLILFPYISEMDTSKFFGNLDLKKFEFAKNEANDTIALIDRVNDIVIDRPIYSKIAATLRRIHGIKKDVRKPANKEARDYMLSVAKRRAKRMKNKKTKSQLEIKIVAMVNTHQYKYDFETTKDLTIYQFNESVSQVIKKVDYENRMYGVYTGSIKASDMSNDDLNWLIH